MQFKKVLLFCTSLLCFVLCVFLDALWDFPESFNMNVSNPTAGIFATYPAKHLTLLNGFFDQVILR